MFAVLSEVYLVAMMRGLTLPKVEVSRPAKKTPSFLRAALRRFVA
jgi:hypothetical protein